MYKWAIFDLDGTLLDTLHDITDNVNAVLEKNGYKPRTYDEVRVYVGNGDKRAIEQSLPDGAPREMVERCLADFKACYAKNLRNKTAPYPGIGRLLDTLKGMGIKMAIVSNKPQSEVRELGEGFFPGYMELVSGERPGIPQKPAPDRLLEAVRKLGADPGKTLFIGDSEVDVQTAKNAGIDCAVVAWGFPPFAVVEAEEPEYIAYEAHDIVDIVEGRVARREKRA